MDPVTFFTAILLGGTFLLSQLRAAKTAKKGDGPKPVESSNEFPEERLVRGRGIGSDLRPGDEAHRVPGQHLPIADGAAATPPVVAEPDSAVIQLGRDRTTGRFQKAKRAAA